MRLNVLLYDPKIILLLIFLVIFLILSIFIIYLELKFKKKSKIKFTQNIEEARINLLKNGLKNARTANEKLLVIDSQAKSLFKERFNLNTQRSYSELNKIFNQKKLYEYSKFCEKMFEAYYAKSVLSDQVIKELLSLLVILIRERTTYLDPETYSIENLISINDSTNDSTNKNTLINSLEKPKSEKLLNEEKLALEERKKSFLSKEQALFEKQKLLSQKEKELAKKELQNKKLIQEIEKKLLIQEKKIKEEEKIQEKISRQINLNSNNSNTLTKTNSKNKSEESQNIKLNTNDSQVNNWRESIEVKPVVGKDWLKFRKKRRE